MEEEEKRQIDRERETEIEQKGVSVERIYEWGLSVGYGPGPSVVHSSVIFTAPQAPMCLPVGAMYTHACTHTLTRTRILYKHGRIRAHVDRSLQRNPVTVQLPLCYVIGQLTSAPSFVFSSFSTSLCLFISDCPPDPRLQTSAAETCHKPRFQKKLLSCSICFDWHDIAARLHRIKCSTLLSQRQVKESTFYRKMVT